MNDEIDDVLEVGRRVLGRRTDILNWDGVIIDIVGSNRRKAYVVEFSNKEVMTLRRGALWVFPPGAGPNNTNIPSESFLANDSDSDSDNDSTASNIIDNIDDNFAQ